MKEGIGREIIPFRDAMEHLLVEMAVIRHMISKKVEDVAAQFASEIDAPYRGFGITPTEALYHLKRADEPCAAKTPAGCDEMRNYLGMRVEASRRAGVNLPLTHLERLFGLNRFEMDVLITCLLPEIYPGFDRVFGFLQDDAGLSCPSLGFLMDVFCIDYEARKAARQSFHPARPLKMWDLVVPVGDELQRPPLRRTYRVDDRIAAYLMGSGQYDGRLDAVINIMGPTQADAYEGEHAGVLVKAVDGVRNGSACYLISVGGENRDMAGAFEKAFAAQLQWAVMTVSLNSLVWQQEWNRGLIEALLREAVLQPAVLVIEDDLNGVDSRLPGSAELLKLFARKGIAILYEGSRLTLPDRAFEAVNYIKLSFHNPQATARLQYWREALGKNGLSWSDDVLEQFAVRYPISQSRIEVLIDRLKVHLNGDGKKDGVSMADFQEIANDYLAQPLDELAQRVRSSFSWDDMVLHKSVRDHLTAFRNTVAHQFKVYETWGFGAKMPRGRGIVALFSGPSGTGKTMAAEVIAADLGINLYRVDMAGLVSKYIGETEKNIKRIFDASKTNVLLFFDEADALFGRRTEMRDSHDRYANLEVNYLLQRLEDHDGPVILATNMRKNMDEAFLRRIHFIIEFPQPSEPFRRLLFQKYLPARMPKADDLDIDLLAKHFEMSGGDIKNAAVQAAFIAAGDGGMLTMEHMLTSMKREYLKLGKIFPSSQMNHIRGVSWESPEVRRRKKGRSASWS